jgi:tetratricopeptide (TPR) repeat protein
MYDNSTFNEKQYILDRLMAETLQSIFKDDRESLWHYASSLYASLTLPSENYHNMEDLKFVLEKFHFDWLLGKHENLIEQLTNFVLPKLGKWGYWSLQKEWLDKILPHTKGINRATCLQMLGRICRDTGKWKNAEHYFNESLALAREENLPRTIATSLCLLGDIARKRVDYGTAKTLYTEALNLRNDPEEIANSQSLLGDVARKQGNYQEAQELYQESLKLRQELQNREGIANCKSYLGDIARLRGNYEDADGFYQE